VPDPFSPLRARAAYIKEEGKVRNARLTMHPLFSSFVVTVTLYPEVK